MLKELFEQAGFSLSEEQERQFLTYGDAIREYNEKINLTTILEPLEMAVKHFLDSVYALPFLEKNATVTDIGSGAGFPAIPLKIMRPDLKIRMVDSLKKRVLFLDATTKLLGLEGTECVHARAEDEGKGERREKTDCAVARAVSALPILAEYCLPLVRTGGLFIAYKGGNCEEELQSAGKALHVLGGKVKTVQKYTLPDGSGRSLIIVEKTHPTPDKYPRGQNKPRIAPLA